MYLEILLYGNFLACYSESCTENSVPLDTKTCLEKWVCQNNKTKKLDWRTQLDRKTLWSFAVT